MEDQEAKNILGAEGVDYLFEQETFDPREMELREEVIKLSRVAKVVKGGRRFSFSALVAVGDSNGVVGLGYGKANEVPAAITKGVEAAKRNLFRVWLKGSTLPHEVIGKFGSARVMLKPASDGTGIIASTAVRQVLELAGVNNVLTKSLGSSNQINVVKATVNGLERLRRAEQVAALRNRSMDDMLGKRLADEFREEQQIEDKAAPIAETQPDAQSAALAVEEQDNHNHEGENSAD